MEQETPIMSILVSSLLDATDQPNLVINSSQSQQLIWRLVNNQPADLVVKPFAPGKVDPEHYNFLFEFAPGALTDKPTLQGWDVYAKKDGTGGITSLYVAYLGSEPLRIRNGQPYAAPLTYTNAKQEDSNRTRVGVTLTTGQQVALGERDIPFPPGKSFSFDLTLVKADTPALSAPPLAVDFVGRRTLLNDGETANSFTFALTNMTEAALPLTPKVVFSVWFDVADNNAGGSPYALTRVEDLASEEFVKLALPSTDWTFNTQADTLKETTVSRQWKFTVSNNLGLQPQAPVYFTFSGIKTDLDPGVSRMYLRFENLPGFRPGVLIAELEKTPLQYGATRGKGLYLSAGTSPANTSPAPNYDSGLYVEQFGDAPAATFKGGRGLEVGDFDTQHDQYIALRVTGGQRYAAGIKLRAYQENVGFTIKYNDAIPALQVLRHWNGDPIPAFTIEATAGKMTVNNDLVVEGDINGKTLTIGGDALVVSKDKVTTSKPLTVTDRVTGDSLTIGTDALLVGGNGKVGIGISQPAGSTLAVNGSVAIGNSYAQTNTTIEAGCLGVAGKVGIVTTTPKSSLSVAGGVAIGKTYANTEPPVTENDLAVEGKVGIGVMKPNFPLSFSDALGEKISLYGQAGAHYGMGIQSSLLQIYAGSSTAAVAFGYGSSSDFTPTMSVQGDAVTGKGMLVVGPSNPNTDSRLALTTGAYTAFVDTAYHAEICNETVTGGYKALMICGNRSRGGANNTRWVQVYDNLEVSGELIVQGLIWSKYAGYYQFLGGYGGSEAGTWWHTGTPPSDVRLKRGVQTIHSALDKIRRLCGVTFRWNENGLQHFTRDIETTLSAGPNATEQENQKVWQTERDKRRNQLSTTQVGVLAQDVEAVLPEAVTTGADGYKLVRYDNLIPLLIEAFKEQDLVVTAQAALTARLQTEIEQLKQALPAVVPPSAAD